MSRWPWAATIKHHRGWGLIVLTLFVCVTYAGIFSMPAVLRDSSLPWASQGAGALWQAGLLTGGSPLFCHAANLALHLGVTLGLFVLLLSQQKPSYGPGPLVVSLLFGLAPLQSESVLGAGGRPLLLGTLLLLLALGLSRKPSGWSYLGVLLAGALALAGQGFVLAPVLLALDGWLSPKARSASQLKLALLAMSFVLGLAVRGGLGGVRLWAEGFQLATVRSYAFVLLTYSRLALSGHGLDPFHPAYLASPTATVVTFVGLALITTGLVLLARSDRSAKRWRTALVGWSWFVLTLVPVAWVGPRFGVFGDRSSYLPMAGLCLVGASGVDSLHSRITQGSSALTPRAIFGAAFGLICLAQAWLTVGRIQECSTEASLLAVSLSVHPHNLWAIEGLAYSTMQNGSWPKFQIPLLKNYGPRLSAERLMEGVCLAAIHQGDQHEAALLCQNQAVLSDLPRRDLAGGGQVDRAQEGRALWLSASEQINGQGSEASYLRALAYAKLGRSSDALEQAHAALLQDPKLGAAQDLLQRLSRR